MKEIKLMVPIAAYKTICSSGFKMKDHLYYICYMIIKQRDYYKHFNDGSDYIDIPQNVFTKVITNKVQFQLAKRFLLDNKIIRTDKRSRAGHKAYGYKFADAIIVSGVQLVAVDRLTLVRNIIKVVNARRMERSMKVYKKHFLSTFGINAPAALAWTFDNLLKDLKVITVKSKLKMLDTVHSLLCGTKSDFSLWFQHVSSLYSVNSRSYKKFVKIIDRHIQYLQSIISISSGDLYFTRNKTNGRIDTNLTNLKSELRQFILRSEDMVQIDICNSQPTFLYYLLKEANCHYQEIEVYGQWVLSGEFYEQFKLQYETIAGIKMERDEIKEMMFQILFSKNAQYPVQKRAFQALFPNIYEWICNYKSEDHAKLAITLQKMESNICIDIICKDLDTWGIGYYTIHDSWIVTKRNVAKVKELVLNAFSCKYDSRPALKATNLVCR